jgi:hypothetical protein
MNTDCTNCYLNLNDNQNYGIWQGWFSENIQWTYHKADIWINLINKCALAVKNIFVGSHQWNRLKVGNSEQIPYPFTGIETKTHIQPLVRWIWAVAHLWIARAARGTRMFVADGGLMNPHLVRVWGGERIEDFLLSSDSKGNNTNRGLDILIK